MLGLRLIDSSQVDAVTLIQISDHQIVFGRKAAVKARFGDTGFGNDPVDAAGTYAFLIK